MEFNLGCWVVNVVFQYLRSQIWDVNPSIALTRNEKLVWLEFWEQRKEHNKRCHIVIGSYGVVSLGVVLKRASLAKSNTRWTLEPKHVGVSVPAVLVLHEVVLAFWEEVWTVLVGEGFEARAAWATGQPKDDWVGGGSVLALGVYVVHDLSTGVW